MLIEKEIEEEICKGYKEMQFIENIIRSLSEREKLLMRLRYIDGCKWEAICVKMGYEWAQIHRLHSQILKALKNKQS